LSLIKICGLTREADVRLVCDLHVDFAGFVFAPSPRRIDRKRASDLVPVLAGSGVAAVGVFVDEKADTIEDIARTTGLEYVQLCGEEDPDFLDGTGLKVIRSIPVRDRRSVANLDRYFADLFLFDRWSLDRRGGGTGKSFDWDLARHAETARPFLIAGGLNADNVAAAIRISDPAGVDASSGLEKEPGVKDDHLLRLFVKRARAAFAEGG